MFFYFFSVVSVAEATEEVKGDEFWDYDQQVDLESFSTKDFYTTLAKQTSDITAALARQKDQVRILLFYLYMTNQVSLNDNNYER